MGVREYGEYLRRMKDRRLRQYPEYRLICLAHDLENETDHEGNKKYTTQEKIAEKMSEILERDVSPTQVSRALAEYDASRGDWSSGPRGSSQSLTHFKNKPPF